MTFQRVCSSLAFTFLLLPLTEQITAATIQTNILATESTTGIDTTGRSYTCTKHNYGDVLPDIGCVDDGENGITRSNLSGDPFHFQAQLFSALEPISTNYLSLLQAGGQYSYSAQLTPEFAGDKFQFILQETDTCTSEGIDCPKPFLSITGAQSIRGNLATGEVITARNPVSILLVGTTLVDAGSALQAERLSSSLTLTLLDEKHPKKSQEQESDTAVTPEPATMALFMFAMPLLWFRRNRK